MVRASGLSDTVPEIGTGTTVVEARTVPKTAAAIAAAGSVGRRCALLLAADFSEVG